MYKAIIIDDESFMRKTIRSIGLWEKFNIKVVDEASNGNEAYCLITNIKPDIVILDMKMPGMSGNDLLKILKEEGLNVKVIVISAYDDFKYTKQAISYGVCEYVLKPINRVEFNKALEIVVQSIKKEQDIKDRLLVNNMVQDNTVQFIREQVLLNSIEHGFKNSVIPGFEYFKDFNFTHNTAAILVVSNFYDLCKDKDENDLSNRIVKLIKDVAKTDISILVLKKSDSINQFIIVFGAYETQIDKLKMSVLSKIKYIRLCLNKELGVSSIVSLGGIYKEVSNLSQSYKEARNILYTLNLLSDKKIWLLEDIEVDPDIQFLAETRIENLKFQIKNGSSDPLVEFMELYFKEISAKQYVTCRKILYFADKYLEIIGSIYKEHGKTFDSLHAFQERIKQAIDTYNINLIRSSFIEIALTIKTNMEMCGILTGEDKIGLIYEYVDKHFQEDISLKTIAKNFYLSKEHICRAFKNKYKINLTEHIHNKRMEKAKELLKQNMTIHCIAELLGYRNVAYFNRQFKKHFSMTPTEYIEKNK